MRQYFDSVFNAFWSDSDVLLSTFLVNSVTRSVCDTKVISHDLHGVRCLEHGFAQSFVDLRA